MVMVAALTGVFVLNSSFSVFGEEVPKVFPDYKAVGELSQEEKAQYFKEIEEKYPQMVLAHKDVFWGDKPKPYEHTEHQIGYLPFFPLEEKTLKEIKPARSIKADTMLKNIDIRLDRLRVYDYPGGGKHQVMFTFKSENNLTDKQKESIAFSQVYEAQEGEGAGISGYPIFINLNVGKQGTAFQGATINVKNDGDENALEVLKSKEFQSGLTLLALAQPAIMPFTALGTGIAKMILSRNKNKKVQEFYLGLDFDDGASYGGRLAVGNYVVVQAPDKEFKWEEWAYDPVNTRIVKKNTPDEIVPYNYIVFRVTKHSD